MLQTLFEMDSKQMKFLAYAVHVRVWRPSGYLLELGVHMPHIPVKAMTLPFRLYQIQLVLLLRETQWNALGPRSEGVEQIFVLVQPGLRYDF